MCLSVGLLCGTHCLLCVHLAVPEDPEFSASTTHSTVVAAAVHVVFRIRKYMLHLVPQLTMCYKPGNLSFLNFPSLMLITRLSFEGWGFLDMRL